ncbi:MAG: YraN family protein [Myxococcales bacterium]|nr:YraN family protein [Myxococcales bacterium]
MAAHLAALGWVIVGTNVRLSRHEVDVLARDGDTLVLVEVKARRRGAMVDPLSSITPRKQDQLRRAALHLAARDGRDDLRIDVVCVVDGAIVEHLVGAVDFSLEAR